MRLVSIAGRLFRDKSKGYCKFALTPRGRCCARWTRFAQAVWALAFITIKDV